MEAAVTISEDDNNIAVTGLDEIELAILVHVGGCHRKTGGTIAVERCGDSDGLIVAALIQERDQVEWDSRRGRRHAVVREIGETVTVEVSSYAADYSQRVICPQRRKDGLLALCEQGDGEKGQKADGKKNSNLHRSFIDQRLAETTP